MRGVKAKTVDEYLEFVSDKQRPALEALRKVIRSTAPKAEECISYGIPLYRLNGHLVGFGATAKHCSFYVMSGSVLEGFQEEVSSYDSSKGTIRFQPDRPLPASLVRNIVKARILENTIA